MGILKGLSDLFDPSKPMPGEKIVDRLLEPSIKRHEKRLASWREAEEEGVRKMVKTLAERLDK